MIKSQEIDEKEGLKALDQAIGGSDLGINKVKIMRKDEPDGFRLLGGFFSQLGQLAADLP